MSNSFHAPQLTRRRITGIQAKSFGFGCNSKILFLFWWLENIFVKIFFKINLCFSVLYRFDDVLVSKIN